MLPFVLVATFWRLSEDNTDPLSVFDLDGNGSLDRDEFKAAVHGSIKMNPIRNAKDKDEPLPDAAVLKEKAAVVRATTLALVAVVVPAAAAPVTDAKEGEQRLEKLTADCGVYLKGSPELQTALNELEGAIKTEKVFEALDTDKSGAYQLSLSGCYLDKSVCARTPPSRVP